jgi:hypothetical protein
MKDQQNESVEQVDEKVVPYNKELLARMIDLVQDYLVDMSSHGDITEKDYKSAMAVIKKIAGDKVAAEVSSDKAISKLLYGRHGVFGTDIMRDRQGLSGRKKNKSGTLSKVSMSNFKKDVERAMSKHQKVTRKLPESVEHLSEGISVEQFDRLKSKQKVTIDFSSVMGGSGSKEFIVTRKSKLKGGKIEKITLKSVKNPMAQASYLYKRDGKVAMAQGDMAVSAKSLKEGMRVEPYDVNALMEKAIEIQYTDKPDFGEDSALGYGRKEGYKEVGVIGTSARTAMVIFKLNAFDKKYTKSVRLKAGEEVFRYTSRGTVAGSIMPLIKVNMKRGLAYYLTQESSSGEIDEPVFETKSQKLKFIRLLTSAYKPGHIVKEDVELDEGLNTWGPTRSSVMRIRKQNDADRSQARKEKEPELLDDAKDTINHYLKKTGGLPKTLSRYDSNFYQSAIQQIERISGKTAAKKEVAKAIKKYKGVKESVEQIDEAFPSHGARNRAGMRKIVNAAKRDAYKAAVDSMTQAKAGLKLAIKDADDESRAEYSKEVIRLQKLVADHAKVVSNIKEDVEQIDEIVAKLNKNGEIEMTKKKYAKVHRDFKGKWPDGEHYVTQHMGRQGMTQVPVKFVKEDTELDEKMDRETKKTARSLMRLGDNPRLAVKTAKAGAKKGSASKAAYRKAYESVDQVDENQDIKATAPKAKATKVGQRAVTPSDRGRTYPDNKWVVKKNTATSKAYRPLEWVLESVEQVDEGITKHQIHKSTDHGKTWKFDTEHSTKSKAEELIKQRMKAVSIGKKYKIVDR